MRNERFVPMTNSRSLIPHHITRGGNIYGGAVPQLRLAIQKNPVYKVLEGSGIGANRPVGIISPAPTLRNPPSKPTLDKPTFNGGDLLNSISFGSSSGKKGAAKRDNIKFIF